MKTKLKNASPLPLLAGACALLVLGILTLASPHRAWELVVVAGMITLFGYGGLTIIAVLFRLDNSMSTVGRILTGFITIASGFLLYNAPSIAVMSISMVIGIWFIISGLLIALNGVLIRQDGAVGMGKNMVTALINAILGILMISGENKGAGFLAVVTGIYLIVMSFNLFTDAFFEFTGTDLARRNFNKHIRLPIPSLIAAFIPSKTLERVNKALKADDSELEVIDWTGADPTVDLEVFIHTMDGFIEGMGHVDLCVGQRVLSYGNYDSEAWKMGGFIARGVLAQSEKEGYIRHCLNYEKKTLISFGLSLTDEQKDSVDKHIRNLESDFERWECKAELCVHGELPEPLEQYKDAASELYKDAGAVFNKFKKGNPFRTYFAVGTNCVMLADTIVGRSGVDLIKLNGIITPGAYLAYLNDLYERGDTIVVKRNIYRSTGDSASNEAVFAAMLGDDEQPSA